MKCTLWVGEGAHARGSVFTAGLGCAVVAALVGGIFAYVCRSAAPR